MKLIVGLGNPGKEYNNTRHNIGFEVIDRYLGNVKFKEKFDGLYYEYICDEKIIFIKPQTFMNNSGFSLVQYVKYYNVNPDDIMVIHDDLDLKIGTFKFKFNSSSGGHNGIKSIINNLKTESFFRMKIGISNDKKDDVIDFVLGKFSKKELDMINFDILFKAIDDFIKYDYEYVMNKYNGK
ncbi:MAG: aminoacyl-tRNA hydrolase [Bacilli bacterium]|nr:aminoacyl-tRNA hydrolase [Bacilli bacterium]